MKALNPRSILIRLPNWIGDAVMATPVLLALRNHFPEARLSCIGKPHILELLRDFPNIDAWHSLTKYSMTNPVPQYDVGLLLTRSFSSAWDLFKYKIPRRIGFTAHFRKLLLTDALPVPENEEEEHAVITYLRLVEAMTGMPQPPRDPQLFVPHALEDETATSLEKYDITSHHTVIGINPGAAYGSAKCWPKERFRELAYKLLEQSNVRILFFGDRSTKPLVDEICARMPPRVVNLSGITTITQLKGYLKRLSLLITNDSGPMHMASALRIPTVAIFGSTNPIKTGPWYGGDVIQHETACSPCYLRRCPIDFRCMLKITTEMVVERVRRKV